MSLGRLAGRMWPNKVPGTAQERNGGKLILERFSYFLQGLPLRAFRTKLLASCQAVTTHCMQLFFLNRLKTVKHHHSNKPQKNEQLLEPATKSKPHRKPSYLPTASKLRGNATNTGLIHQLVQAVAVCKHSHCKCQLFIALRLPPQTKTRKRQQRRLNRCNMFVNFLSLYTT